ncbi:MAG: prepilin-type N-terminal cleavage/methylation domain-containing protein [Vicinamibacterales bacterium]
MGAHRERSAYRRRGRSTLPPTNDRGFTLIEVLIAMVIMTVALVSMAELMAVMLRMQMMGRNETAAVRLIQSKIDEVVNVSFTTTTLANVGGSLTSDVTNFFDTPANGFKRRWQITAITGETKVRNLTVRVIPTVTDSRTTAQIELSTIIRSP